MVVVVSYPLEVGFDDRLQNIVRLLLRVFLRLARIDRALVFYKIAVFDLRPHEVFQYIFGWLFGDAPENKLPRFPKFPKTLPVELHAREILIVGVRVTVRCLLKVVEEHPNHLSSCEVSSGIFFLASLVCVEEFAG